MRANNAAASKVLIVDANPAVAALAVALGRAMSVTMCATASDAFAHMVRGQPSVVIVDDSLPDLDIVAFVRSLRFKGNCPVIVVTSARDSRMLHDLSALGIDGVFERPVQVDRLIRHVFSLCSLSPRVPRRPVSRAIEHLSASYASRVTLTSVARAVAVSPSYLAHAFKADMDMTVMAFVSRIRIEVARRMLIETDASLRKVAEAVGLADAPSFSRAFRRHTGFAPGHYRRTTRGQAG